MQYSDLSSKQEAEPSSDIRKRVNASRNAQKARFSLSDEALAKSGATRTYFNAHMGPKQIKKYCHLNPESQGLLRNAIENLGLSARAYDRILKVSRTIADLEGSEDIQTTHIAEAIQYRSLDRDYWKVGI